MNLTKQALRRSSVNPPRRSSKSFGLPQRWRSEPQNAERGHRRGRWPREFVYPVVYELRRYGAPLLAGSPGDSVVLETALHSRSWTAQKKSKHNASPAERYKFNDCVDHS